MFIFINLYIRKALLKFINYLKTILSKFLKSNKQKIITKDVYFTTLFKIKKRQRH